MTMTTDRRALLAGGFGLAVTAAAGWPVHARSSTTFDVVLDVTFADLAPVALGGAIVTAEGLAWQGVRGVRQSGNPELVETADKWHLGSNAKAMTAAVYGRLVDRGDARWDATVSDIFTDVSIDAAWDGVTLRDLMHHRAGLDDAAVLGRDWLMSARRDPASLVDQRTALAAKAFSAAPGGERQRFAYANANYVMIGAAIERLTGRSWEDAMRTELFEPLGLSSAGFGAPRTNARDDPNAWGHRGAAAPLTPMDPASPGADNPLAMSPAGGVHMTLADYAVFLRAMIRMGDGWLKPETVGVLVTPPEDGEPYAGGWGVRRNGAGDKVLGHDGSNTLWHATASLNLTSGVAFVGVTNQLSQKGATRVLVKALSGAREQGARSGCGRTAESPAAFGGGAL